LVFTPPEIIGIRSIYRLLASGKVPFRGGRRTLETCYGDGVAVASRLFGFLDLRDGGGRMEDLERVVERPIVFFA